ncbi:hypothetical protein CLNEO_06410 [Anaerotignum neopropionicum]|uniref:ABC-transporter type IV n=1 Tax=Anaerotignum neopropionicum TaxID=36847 RepID=A0A136WJ91_9FIRM|nr:hypothetical protein [Anaerotignum neopropionicum]KXL54534.1 hypothetical protein CLNEO_06410 [Anaerotignum neopropionicum]
MDAFFRRIMVFLIGGLAYVSLEILYRGYSHWTMFFTGGFAFFCLFALFTAAFPLPFWARCIAGALIVTTIEFTVGIVVNKLLGWHVWDYSRLPCNLFGQISLLFSTIWLVLCIPIGFFARMLNQKILSNLLPSNLYFMKNKKILRRKIHQ